MVKAFDSGSISSDIARRLGQLERDETATHAPTILLCGRNLAGSSVVFTCVLNSVITSRLRNKRHTTNHGILVVDLDSTAPVFSPVGTTSLVHVAEPLLGSSWHFPANATSMTDSGPIRILKMLYVDQKEDVSADNNPFDTLLEQLRNIRQKQYRECPVIVKACNMLDRIDLHRGLALTKQLAPDVVICYGSESGSTGVQLASLVEAECNTLPLITVPISTVKELPLTFQHELMLQSYCHLRGYYLGQPMWSHLPLELDRSCRLWLSIYGESAFGLKILVPKTGVDTVITLDALAGCMVAVSLATGPSEDLAVINARASAVPVEKQRPIRAEKTLECLGFAVVAGFSADKRSICLLTPISHLHLDTHRKDGGCVVLVVQPVDLDGRYDTAWVQSELDTLVEERRIRKTVFRRKLSVL